MICQNLAENFGSGSRGPIISGSAKPVRKREKEERDRDKERQKIGIHLKLDGWTIFEGTIM